MNPSRCLALIWIVIAIAGCSDSEGPDDGWTSHSSSILHTHNAAPISLSLRDGPTVNEEFGVELLSIEEGRATIRSTKSGNEDSASQGEYFAGGDFGKAGLVLVSVDVETQSADMIRFYSKTFVEPATP